MNKHQLIEEIIDGDLGSGLYQAVLSATTSVQWAV
jgi:hypothetical protein